MTSDQIRTLLQSWGLLPQGYDGVSFQTKKGLLEHGEATGQGPPKPTQASYQLGQDSPEVQAWKLRNQAAILAKNAALFKQRGLLQ